MTQFKWSSLSYTQKSLDLSVLFVALAASVWILYPVIPELSELIVITHEMGAISLCATMVLLVGWYLCLSSLALYSSRRLARWQDDLADVTRAVGLCALTLAAIAQVFSLRGIVLIFLLVFWALASVLLFSWRCLKRVVMRRARLHGRNIRHVIIVGAGPRGQHLADILHDHPELGFNLIGFVDNTRSPGVIGPLNELAQILDDHIVNEIMIALPIKSYYEELREIVHIAEEQGVVVRFDSELFDLHLARARAEYLDGVPMLTLYGGPPSNWRSDCKRMIDLLGATALLVLFSPLMLLIALVIKLTSPGPVFFVQERLGLNKRRFPMFKFRTMVADAEERQKELETMNEADGPVFKIRNDPRVTPLGRWLRKTSLDELPQLFNILRGELSLVGPRPLPARDFERFDEYWFNRRFSVKPGLTCIWQVSGRSETSFDRWIKQDLEYIDNWSLALDLKLLLKTIPAVLRGTGAT
jgi:exopolysaccharide biosynthesis polyprenyl glycosylphosphotransferase